MDKIKIAYISPRFHPFKGGAETNLLQKALRMSALGHDVTVYTTNTRFRDEKLSRLETYQGIKIIRHWQVNEQLYAGFYPRLIIDLLKNNFDVIHSSGIGFFWREICLILKRLISKKTLFINTPHGPFMAINDSKGFRGFAKRVGTILLNLYINKLYDKFISVNPIQHIWMEKEYGIKDSQVAIIPNGIEESYLEKDLVEHKKEEKVIISFVGRMEWYKGIQMVIKSLVPIKKLNWEFIIMGRSGSYTANIKKLIQENELDQKIKIIFSPSDDQRDDILKNFSQITILPSKWEAFGISLVEAMAKGNVIITTNQNEGKDLIIKDGISGFSYDFNDTKNLTKILKDLITNYKKRSEIRIHNLSFARSFTWESIFPSYAKLIKDSMKNA